MSTELAINTKSLIPDQGSMSSIAYMAKQAANSKFYANMGGEAGITAIILLARELDIPPMQALSGGIWNIQGKVEMSARMMNMKIRQAGHKLKIDSATTTCSITGTRKDTGEELIVTYTLEDASRAGLSTRDTWKKYPREMLFNRCLSILARMLFPDVIGNCYVEGEMKEVFEMQEEEKRSKKRNPQLLEQVEVEEAVTEQVKPSKITPITEESVSEEEIQVLKEALGNDVERIGKLMKFYELNDIGLISREQYQEAIQIAGCRK